MKKLTSKSISLNNELKQICNIIQRRLGIVVQKYQVEILKDFLKNTMKKKNIFFYDYISYIKTCPIKSAEYEELIKIISIDESYFFRDKDLMRSLYNDLLPSTIKNNLKSKTIKIWSAGCAAGQELYTIAILLKELLPDIDKWTINLIGTDICVQSILKATKGHYTSGSLRGIDSIIKDKYFKKSNNKFILVDDILKMGTFFYLNLVDCNYPSIFNRIHSLDLIVCRNVLLYFEEKTIKKILEHYSDSLVSQGVLVINQTDLKGNMIPAFKREYKDKVIFYHRNNKTLEIEQIKDNNFSYIDSSINTITEAQLDKLKSLHLKEDWHGIILYTEELINSKVTHSKIFLYEAIANASLGNSEKALSDCKQALLLDDLNPENYLVFAIILQELNQLKEAESKLRQSLFLDFNFIDAHYCLGMLMLRQNKIITGIKELKIALKILKTKKPEQVLFLTPKVSNLELAEVLSREINIYSVAEKASYE